LEGTEHQWIKDLIGAFNNGEIGKFESLSTNFSNEVSISFRALCAKLTLLANSSKRLLLPPTKDMSDGPHPIRFLPTSRRIFPVGFIPVRGRSDTAAGARS
jgi:hypothetical protein